MKLAKDESKIAELESKTTKEKLESYIGFPLGFVLMVFVLIIPATLLAALAVIIFGDTAITSVERFKIILVYIGAFVIGSAIIVVIYEKISELIKSGRGYLLACMATAVMLVIALADAPYDYYVILRFVILIVSGYGVMLFYETNGKLAFVFAICALFYNPFFPMRLSKEAW